MAKASLGAAGGGSDCWGISCHRNATFPGSPHLAQSVLLPEQGSSVLSLWSLEKSPKSHLTNGAEKPSAEIAGAFTPDEPAGEMAASLSAPLDSGPQKPPQQLPSA